MKIAIIFGGVSFEREVSIETAKSVLLNIDNKYDILEIDYCGDFHRLIEQIKVNRIDLVFNALHGGDGENGVLQKVLEDNNIRFTGSGSDACKKAMNKSITKDICNKNNIPVPEGLIVNDFDQLHEMHQRGIISSNKIVIKPIDEGSSADLYIMTNNSRGLNNPLHQKTEYMLQKYESFLLEEYIEGRELTIGILDGIALPIVEIIPKERLYNYECKYTAGMCEYSVPAKLDCKIQKKIEEYALKLYNFLGCRHYSRIDIRLDDKNNIYILELNTLPGMTQTSLFPKAASAYGIEFKQLIDKIINLA